MKIILFLLISCFALFSLTANFIDDPNFDLPTDAHSISKSHRPKSIDCLSMSPIQETDLTNPLCTWNFLPNNMHGRIFVKSVKYREHLRDVVIHDQYYEYSYGQEPRSGLRGYELLGFNIIPGIFAYVMCKVPQDVQLYFLVEVGHKYDQTLLVEVILEEITNRMNPKGRDYNAIHDNHILSKKRVEIHDQNSWTLIQSDYPAYKKHECSILLLKIIFPEKTNAVQLNYAQVGTDPKALGGRGARNKNFENMDEL
ncbi:MAG: hypothetical protein WCK42_05025 [Myxococcaceae bacterium]